MKLALFDNPGYHIGPSTDATAMIGDNEINVPPLSLRLASAGTGMFELTLTGPATRAFTIEATTTLTNWQTFTTLVSGPNGSARVFDWMETDSLFFRAKQEQ